MQCLSIAGRTSEYRTSSTTASLISRAVTLTLVEERPRSRTGKKVTMEQSPTGARIWHTAKTSFQRQYCFAQLLVLSHIKAAGKTSVTLCWRDMFALLASNCRLICALSVPKRSALSDNGRHWKVLLLASTPCEVLLESSTWQLSNPN